MWLRHLNMIHVAIVCEKGEMGQLFLLKIAYIFKLKLYYCMSPAAPAAGR